MKKKIVLLFFLSMLLAPSVCAQHIPYKQAFLNYWVTFKNALRNNDADFLFNTITIPFDSQGSYFNPEADMTEIKENYQEIFPRYRKEMDYVRFDAVLIEDEGAYIWLGYSLEDEEFFYCYKKMAADGNNSVPTLEEKHWFKLVGNEFKMHRSTIEYE